MSPASGEDLANFLFEQESSIIGTISCLTYGIASASGRKQFIAYSLEILSLINVNQPRDGGAMVKLTLTKQDGRTHISDSGSTHLG